MFYLKEVDPQLFLAVVLMWLVQVNQMMKAREVAMILILAVRTAMGELSKEMRS